jgi:hypothetical protein
MGETAQKITGRLKVVYTRSHSTFTCLGGKRSSGGTRLADASDRTPDRTPGGSTVESTGRTEPEERNLASADRVFIAVTEEQFEALAERVGTEVSVE